MNKNKSLAKFFILLLILTLAACSRGVKDQEMRLGDRFLFPTAVDRWSNVESDPKEALLRYAEVLETEVSTKYRARSTRRLADLSLELKVNEILDESVSETDEDAEAVDAKEQSKAKLAYDPILLYQTYLSAYPEDEDNDQVLYQLANAYEQLGEFEKSLDALNQLITLYPHSQYTEEAQFRRGETYFSLRQYQNARVAYQSVIAYGVVSEFYEKALFKQGWTLFKMNRYDDALFQLFALLDELLHDVEDTRALSDYLSQGEIELVVDTLRVVSLNISLLKGVETANNFLNMSSPKNYENLIFIELAKLYIKQERVRDAADAYLSFVHRNPEDSQSPALYLRVIDLYEENQFHNLAFNAKKAFINRYNKEQALWLLFDEEGKNTILRALKRMLPKLAQHYHSETQKHGKNKDFKTASRWYELYIKHFPANVDTAHMHFMYSELLFARKHYAAAATHYDKSAYEYPDHGEGARAAYGALVAYDKRMKELKAPMDRKLWLERKLTSLNFFHTRYPNHQELPAVTAQMAQEMFKLERYQTAYDLAQRILSSTPNVDQRYVVIAWSIIGHIAFQSHEYGISEVAYSQLLPLYSKSDHKHNETLDRIAASVYRQGEQALNAKQMESAVKHFLRLDQVATNSRFNSKAQLDAARILINIEDWDRAINVLSQFLLRYPQHDQAPQVRSSLAVAYESAKRYLDAARAFENIAEQSFDVDLQRESLLTAAEHYDNQGAFNDAIRVYRKYAHGFPEPLDVNVEIQYRLTQLYERREKPLKRRYWLENIIKTNKNAGNRATDRSQFLAAYAAMEMAKPLYEEFNKISLVAPLNKNLRQKKEKMQAAINAYQLASSFNVAEFKTDAVFHTAKIYRDFAHALMTSERPSGLNEEELEEYDFLLEEQAFPFEEKAIKIHEANLAHTVQGLYDQWVQGSLHALSTLVPARYDKTEVIEEIFDVLR